jgi:3-hydroxy-3-methylglutaryl CoA synthase
MGGEKAVAGHDEDSVTLAVNAALNAVPDGDPRGIDAIYFASTTPPYREKQSATTIAAVLDAGSALRTADFTDSLRAATSALRAGLDVVAAGGRRALVCAGDCRMGEPDTQAEQNYGDAGAALLLGADGEPVVAQIIGAHSVSEEFHGTWRADQQNFLHAFPGAFESKLGYTPFVLAAIQAVLKATGTAPDTIAKAVIAAPNPRAAAGVAKALKIDPKTQLQDTLWTLLGDTGCTQPVTNDYLHDSPDSPTTHGVVELDGGGRLYVHLTDVDADQVEIDMPVELTFRKYHDGSGLKNYFWKARPAA